MKARSKVLLIACVAVFAMMPTPALQASEGQGQNGKAKGNKHAGKGGAVVYADADAWMDRDHCRVVVCDYVDQRGLPPGLAKKGSLPPGLRKQLKERGHLPPGLEKHMVAVPVELERDLPPLPPHHARFFVDSDLIVVDVRTNFCVSIVAGVFIRH